jgi:DNA-binding transcriptional MerR regulator
MNLTDDLRGSRVTLTRAAELAGMHPAHFRRLIRQGVFPKPKKTAKGRPYFDYDLLSRVAEILSSGIAANGQEVLFYRRKNSKPAVRHLRRLQPPDPYLKELAQCLRQMGASKEQLSPERLDAILVDAFGKKRPDLSVSLPVVIQRLFP